MVENGHLIIDFSEDSLALHCKGYGYVSDVSTNEFFTNTSNAIEAFKEEIADKNFDTTNVVFSIPVSCIHYQIVTLPDNVSDKEKMVFLGLEINRQMIGKKFGIQRLDVTQREEGEQKLCDYLVLSPRSEIHKKLDNFATALGFKIQSVVPSFFLASPGHDNELRATAWVGNDRSEVVIWGKGFPLAISQFANSGDQMGDINRFIVDYFDHVDNLNLSMIHLFGPRMNDSGLGFGLTYPHVIFDEPTKFIQNNLGKASKIINISNDIKLPRPPIPMTPRNITFIGAAVVAMLLVFMTFFNNAKNFRLERQVANLQRQSSKYKKLFTTYKKYEKESVELANEKEFYLDITKRRTPWQRILVDVSGLTPKEVWFERFNASKNKVIISGKARTAEDVSSLSINLNNNSRYLNDALIMGTRDYDEGAEQYSEFQLSAKLKSPTGKYSEIN